MSDQTLKLWPQACIAVNLAWAEDPAGNAAACCQDRHLLPMPAVKIVLSDMAHAKCDVV